jgi:CBS-domain-containing membrane protein
MTRQTLLDNNILSAPVWDATQQMYTGFLDVRDLVSWVVFVYDEQKVKDNTRLVDLIQHGQGQFKMSGTDGVTVSCTSFSYHLSDVLDLSRRHRFQSVTAGQPLTKVVEFLASGMHRVPVVKDGKVINIISQTNVIQVYSFFFSC